MGAGLVSPSVCQSTAKPSNRLLTTADMDSDAWVAEVKRIRGKSTPLSSVGLHALRDGCTGTIESTRNPA